jgi:hypothetical protein
MDRSVGGCCGRVTVGVAWGVAAGEETVEWEFIVRTTSFEVAIELSAKTVRL